MKKIPFLFVLLISSTFLFPACGTTPDQSKDEIKVFLNGNGYDDVVEIIDAETEFPSGTAPYIAGTTSDSAYVSHSTYSNGRNYFDYIVLAKKENQKFLLLISSDDDFPKIVYKIKIDVAFAIAKPKSTTLH